MKKLLALTCFPCLMALAAAQEPSQQQNTTGQSTSGASAGQTDTTTRTTTTGSQTTTTTTTTGTATSGSTTLQQMKTQTYKGTLVDAGCAMPGAAAGATASTAETGDTTSADRSTAPDTKTDSDRTTSKKAKSGADRSDAGGQSCAVSTSTSQFGLRMNDGHTVRFDMVGNQRAQEAVKNKKRWNEAAASNKSIHAKVNGVLQGDKLTVMSID